MKKLGLIGGMGPESTIPYYHDIVYGVHDKVGTFPCLTIESVNVFELLSLCESKNYKSMIEMLAQAIKNVKQAGADFAALSANTPHIVFDELQSRCNIPLISIVDATVNESKRRGLHCVGLLGTRFTMEESFYTDKFASAGISVLVPDEQERLIIGEKITSELELGIVKEDTVKYLHYIADELRAKGAENIVLGCTELPLAFNAKDSEYLDTMQIHINSIVQEIVG